MSSNDATISFAKILLTMCEELNTPQWLIDGLQKVVEQEELNELIHKSTLWYLKEKTLSFYVLIKQSI